MDHQLQNIMSDLQDVKDHLREWKYYAAEHGSRPTNLQLDYLKMAGKIISNTPDDFIKLSSLTEK